MAQLIKASKNVRIHAVSVRVHAVSVRIRMFVYNQDSVTRITILRYDTSITRAMGATLIAGSNFAFLFSFIETKRQYIFDIGKRVVNTLRERINDDKQASHTHIRL